MYKGTLTPTRASSEAIPTHIWKLDIDCLMGLLAIWHYHAVYVCCKEIIFIEAQVLPKYDARQNIFFEIALFIECSKERSKDHRWAPRHFSEEMLVLSQTLKEV